MPSATFSGTYTANNGEDYAAGTITITPFGGSPVVETLDATGAYSATPTLVLTSETGLWLNREEQVVTTRPKSGSLLIAPGGAITRAKVRVEEAITGAPPKSYVLEVTDGQVIDTSRDVGTVLGGAAAGIGVDIEAVKSALSGTYLQPSEASAAYGLAPAAMTVTAINAALAASDGDVVLKAGTYTGSESLVVPDGRRVTGMGTGVSRAEATTIIEFDAGVNGVVLGRNAEISGIYLWSAEAGTGTATGLVPAARANPHNLTIEGFGSHGILSDSSTGINRNVVDGHHIRIIACGGDGLHILGSNSNAQTWRNMDIVLNSGWGINNDSNCNIIQAHIAANTLGAVIDQGNSNDYDLYVEVDGGEEFHINSDSSYGHLKAPFFGLPNITYDSVGTLGTWTINRSGSWVQELRVSAVNQATGKNYALRTGNVAPTWGEITNVTDGQRIMAWSHNDRINFYLNPRPAVDNSVDVGSTSQRWRHLFQSGYSEITEITDPAAPAADRARLFVRDNGAGKTQLCVRFPTGAVQVLATEP